MITVLYVDDEPDLLALGKAFLEEKPPLKVQTAISAADAMEKMKKNHYDAIVSDYLMPGINGIQFLKIIRATGSEIPFIIFTGRGREEVVIEALNDGADFYLQKGGEPESQFAELEHKIKIAVYRQRMKTRLRESEANYTLLSDTMEESLSVIDGDGKILFTNRNAAENLAGSVPAAVTGKNILEMVPGEEGKRLLGYFQLSIATSNPVIRDVKLRVKSKERWFHNVIRPFRFGKESVPAVLSISLDITDRKVVENALRESEAKFRGLFESQPEIGFLIDKEDGRILDVNTAAVNEYGYTKEEFTQLSDRDISLEPGEPVGSGTTRHASSPVRYHRRKNGSVFPIEIKTAIIVIKGSNVIFATARNITARISAEKELQIAHEKYTKAFLSSPDAITISDLKTGEFIEMNEASLRILGYSRDEAVGRETVGLGVWASEEDRQSFADTLQEIGHVEGLEVLLRRKGGELFNSSVSADIIVIGDRPCILGLFRDITSTKRLEQSLRRANRQLSVLTGITRHDILNKITVLQGQLSLAKRRSGTTGMSESIKKLERVVGVIRDEIEFTRLYEDLGMNTPVWQDLPGVISRMPSQDGIDLVVSTAGIDVYADPMLEKVFGNLLDNAARHGGHVTEIRVSATQAGRELVIVWEDNGTGIAEDEKEAIFEKGYGKNTGLGLFLAREILAITGMSITETGIPGTGARFEIRVPAGGFYSKGQVT